MEDFACVTFSEHASTKTSAEPKKVDKTRKEVKHDGEKPNKSQENNSNKEEREIIPGVTANMVKPFKLEEWTESMKEVFHQFASHDYESLDTNFDESKRKQCMNDQKQDIGLMAKERGTRKSRNNEQIWIGDTGASCHMTN